MNKLDEDFYSFKRKYNYVKSNEAINRTIIILLIAILSVVFFSALRFVQDMNKFGLWKDGIRSIAILAFTNIVLYSLSFATNNYGVSFCGAIISLLVFCVYWHIILNPKNKIYNAAIWQERQFWWQFDGWQFEKEVGKLFEACGYKVHVTKGSGDGGVDVILYKDGVKSIVQCKHHQNPVSVEPIRALWGCMQDFAADEAIFIASSGYTSGCYDFVRYKENYKLLTLEELSLMAAHLHGKLNDLYKEDSSRKKYGNLAISIYLLICSVILTSVYARDYSPKPDKNTPTKQEKIIEENNNTQATPKKDIVVDNSTELGQYMADVQRRIESNWVLSPDVSAMGLEHIEITVAITVARDGRLLSEPIIKQSSGVPNADRLCIDAVKQSAPFRPLPPDINRDYVDMEFTFEAIKR